MNNLKLLLVGSASVLSMVAVSTAAFANHTTGVAVLDIGDLTVREVEGSPTVVVSYDPQTQVLKTTSTKEETVSQSYSRVFDNDFLGNFYGQDAFRNGSFAADAGYNQATDTVVTSTPNLDGGFTVSEPLVGETVRISDVAVLNLSGIRSERTTITGMSDQTILITGSTGSVANINRTAGVVTTDSTYYYDETGTADFNPDTGVISAPAFESGRYSYQDSGGFFAENFDQAGESVASLDGAGIELSRVDYATGSGAGTTLTADGLTTTGNVRANLVIANDVVWDGGSLVATIADLKDADITLQSNIEAEAATRATADTTLQSNINAEAATRATADTTLQSNINAEAATRATADTTLQSNINAEAATRLAADTALGGRITAEETARIAAVTTEATIRAAADTAEIAARIAADTTLGARIATEVTDRTSADTAIGVRIATEETARAAADTAIGTRITTESNARIAADLAETNARIASDNALGSRITDETNARIAADDVLRDQIASSTATAIALGGNAILPDANFTLAGNMGFYNGATAISINAAGKVGSNTYLTAAVGGGLNKQGKVGGRVGVVFGF